MKIMITILIFPVLLLAQNTEFEKIKIIDSHVKSIDSISNLVNEEVSNFEIMVAHGPQGRKSYSNTRILKHSSQILRICYRLRRSKTDDDLSLYYLDSKLVYAELTIWYGKKRRPIKKQYYFEDEISFHPSNTESKYNPDEEIKILLESRDLIIKASR